MIYVEVLLTLSEDKLPKVLLKTLASATTWLKMTAGLEHLCLVARRILGIHKGGKSIPKEGMILGQDSPCALVLPHLLLPGKIRDVIRSYRFV